MPVSDLKAALADRYRIESELGRGGMATVYLAEDLKHSRKVAIKVLRPDLAFVLGAERFLQEIRVTASLDHPHILTLIDSGEAAGFLWYVVPYVRGESLRQKLNREQQVAMDEALEITRQVAGALDYAHRHQVIHRDLKPENILLFEGEAMLVDFGIALAVREAGGGRLTETGISLGSPHYMSPEQATGDHRLDARTDVYSLGAVLYEMLVGEPPHTGPNVQVVIAKLLSERPTSIRTVRDTVPEHVEAIVMRALAKVPADRFASASQFARALDVAPAAESRRPSRGLAGFSSLGAGRANIWRAAGLLAALGVGGLVWSWLDSRNRVETANAGTADPAAVTASTSDQAVAVLYFADRSPDSSLGPVAEGLTHDLIEQLSHTLSVPVVSTHGVAQFRQTDLPPDSIAGVLHAGTVILGEVVPSGGTVRLQARVLGGMDARRSRFFWLVVPENGMLAARDSLLRWATAAFGEHRDVPAGGAGTDKETAWLLQSRAEYLLARAESDRPSTDRASTLRMLHQADSLGNESGTADPQWTRPLVLRGRVAYRLAAMSPSQERDRRLRDVLRYANRGLSWDSSAAGALELRGLVRAYLSRRDGSREGLDSAARDLEAALRHDSLLWNAHHALGRMARDRRDYVQANLHFRRAYEVDPYHPGVEATLSDLFWQHYDTERFPEATRFCADGARRFARSQQFRQCQLFLMIAPTIPPSIDSAWRVVRELDAQGTLPDSAYQSRLGRLIVAGIIGRAGLTDSALGVLAYGLGGALTSEEQSQLTGYAAIMLARIRSPLDAIAFLRQYLEEHPGHSVVSGSLHWWWRPLLEYPEFQAIIRGR